MPVTDPIDRPITFKPSKLPYDPCHMLAGRQVKGQDPYYNVIHW